MRETEITRKTSEVDIRCMVDLDGKGVFQGKTGNKFLDHMLIILTKHGSFDITLKAEGDLQHHLIEDLGIILGQAYSKALHDRKGIRRFGFAYVPMDDALARAVVDLGGRSFSALDFKTVRPEIEDIVVEDLEHFFTSFTEKLKANVHIDVLYGSNDHHKVEAAVKALALALKEASTIQSGREGEIPSTKGVL